MTEPMTEPMTQPTTTDCTVRNLVPRALFKALSDPTRVAILDHLGCCDSAQSVGEVALAVGADVSVVSRNIGQLRDAGLLRCQRAGKQVLCTLQTSEVVQRLRALADALETCCSSVEAGAPEEGVS